MTLLDTNEIANIKGGTSGPDCESRGPECGTWDPSCDDPNETGGNTTLPWTGGPGNTNDPTDPSITPGGGGTVMPTSALDTCPIRKTV